MDLVESLKSGWIKNKTENEFSPWLRAKGSYKAVMRHLQDTCNLLTIYKEFLPKD
jgi:hypothetical protein